MLLIRPLLETNSERKHVRHTVIFFIFVVCNCGGCLLPIGDPPLFLGYLRGVPFPVDVRPVAGSGCSSTACCWPIYYLWDHFWCYPQETLARHRAATRRRCARLKFSGLWPNALLLLGVVLSVALLDPSKPLPGTDWHPWLYLREIVQLGLVGAVAAAGAARRSARRNNFNYHAILEVAALFFGIFICMQAAAADPQRPRAELGADRADAVLLGHRRPLVGAGQRPDLRRLLRDGQDAPGGEDLTPAGGVAEAAADRPSAWGPCSWAR